MCTIIVRNVFKVFANVFITDGGKLEVWDVHSGKSVQSMHAFQDSVTGIKVMYNTIHFV